MLERLARLLDISPNLAAALLAIAAVQFGTQLYALADLARRDVVRGGRKWVWAVAIAMGNLPGALAYLVAGRSVPPTDVSAVRTGAGTAGGEAARRAVDELYGPRDR